MTSKHFRLGEVDYFINLCCGAHPDGRLRFKRISKAAISALIFEPEVVGRYGDMTDADVAQQVEYNRERARLARREIDEAPFTDEEDES